jgi:sec-independent protein translocase protein TatA
MVPPHAPGQAEEIRSVSPPVIYATMMSAVNEGSAAFPARPALQGEIFMGDLFQPWHIIIVALLAVLLFGGKKLPELGKGLGEGLRGFKDGMRGITGEDEEEQKKKDAEAKALADAKVAAEEKAYQEAKLAADAKATAEARLAAEQRQREQAVR